MWSFLCAGLVLLSVQSSKCNACPGVVSRKDWDAVANVHVEYLIRPVGLVIFQHTAWTPCNTDEDCEALMRGIQAYFMDTLGQWDLKSSFFVGGNAKIYEGVGWLHAGNHTPGYDKTSISISFIGDYNKMEPTQDQLDAVKSFLKCGVEEEFLTKDYRVVGQRQLIPSFVSPGRKLYNVIRMWPEWLEDVSAVKNNITLNSKAES